MIRWKDDNGKMISPAVFIPIAEKNGAIIPIGTWVIEESLKAYAEWKRKYNYSMIMSLNISAIQYKQADFIDNVLHLLKKYDISPNEIELEITESILIDDFEEITEKKRNKPIIGYRCKKTYSVKFSCSYIFLKNI